MASIERSAWRRVLIIDQAILMAFRRVHRPAVTSAMRAVTRLGNASSWLAYGLTMLAVGGPGVRASALGTLAAISATLLSQLVKRTCRRPRPDVSIEGFTALMRNPDHFSFPSGHTTTAVAVAVALHGQGAFLGPLASLLAVLIATSRLYLGAHYPLDVLAGVMLGALVGIGSQFALSFI